MKYANPESQSVSPVKPSKQGDKIRAIADKLKAKSEQEKALMSQILINIGKIADNQDKLISEVSEVLQSDLD